MEVNTPFPQSVPRPEGRELTQEELWAEAEGLHPGGVSRTVPTNYTNDGRLEGNTASASAIAEAKHQHEAGHASIGDKVKGNVKLALGTVTGNEGMKQDGEDLKNGDKDRLH